MTIEFPHLGDTKFPHIDNVNVYKYKNNFDYARWNGKVSYKLLNVLWNSNYADVPYFETVEERDEWFDAQDGYVGTLESFFNNTPSNVVKVPIPYNDAYNYNYLVVDMPMQTSADNPINYEDSNVRIKRWFYFIEDMQQFAPSTTELNISVDYWTTFVHTIDIPYLMLERGHAPMTKVSVDEFLANPIENNEYLLAEDFNYGESDVVASSTYVPVGNGKKYVLWCMPIGRDRFDEFGSSNAWASPSTNPSFSNASNYPDSSNRWGNQYVVDGYDWHYGATDYSNANLPISTTVIQTGVLNGCECYAIDSEDAREFFEDLGNHCIQFIHAIKAMFILDEDLFTRDNYPSITFRGKTIYIADRKINTLNLSFNKQAFGFDSKYTNIAKLYTMPYSYLEVTDDYGNSFSAKIEQCGNIQMHTEVALVYPFLKYNMFVSGVNGKGTIDYTWRNVQGTTVDKHIWMDDFSKYMMNWDIPVYGLYASAEQEYAANNFAGIQARREGALVDYHNAARYANNTYANTDTSMNTMASNVNRSASTTENNVYRSADTNITNQGTQNKANEDITDENIAKNTELARLGRVCAGAVNTANNTKITDDVSQDNALTYTTSLQIDNAAIAATTAANVGNSWNIAGVNAVANGISAIASGANGDIGSAISGAASIGTGLFTTNFNTSNANAVSNIQMGVNVDTVAAVQSANNAKATNAKNNNNAVLRANNDYSIDTNRNVNEAMKNNTDTGNAAALAITSATAKTMKDNATDTKNAEIANANATNATETNNADYTRDATVIAEQDNLRQKQREVVAQYRNARLQAPAVYGEYGGDGLPDALQRRGVRFNVRTQTKSAIAQAGDAMLRFGYALHRVWDMSQGFHYGRHFTFWKAEDIWINDGSGTANVATETIGNILLKGVTVWRNPSEIGLVGIYDNI